MAFMSIQEINWKLVCKVLPGILLHGIGVCLPEVKA